MSSSRDLPSTGNCNVSASRLDSSNTQVLNTVRSIVSLWSEDNPCIMATATATTDHMAPPRNPPTQSGSTPSLLELHDRLDSLWISYLRHLDTYTATHKTLQQHLRSGFFSLSRANFNARPGMRYGQDYFHDRAIATRRVEIKQDEGDDGNGPLRLAIVNKQPTPSDNLQNSTSEKTAAVGEGQQQQPSPPATPEPSDDGVESPAKEAQSKPNEASNDDHAATAKMKTSKPPLEADPLRWYGILVPRELRSAQASFSSAMDENVEDAVNASRAMREVEVEIRKLRKEIRKAEKGAKG